MNYTGNTNRRAVEWVFGGFPLSVQGDVTTESGGMNRSSNTLLFCPVRAVTVTVRRMRPLRYQRFQVCNVCLRHKRLQWDEPVGGSRAFGASGWNRPLTLPRLDAKFDAGRAKQEARERIRDANRKVRRSLVYSCTGMCRILYFYYITFGWWCHKCCRVRLRRLISVMEGPC